MPDMILHGVVFKDNPKELAGDPSLFTDEGEAKTACDHWNADYGACETRIAIVVPLTIAVSVAVAQ